MMNKEFYLDHDGIKLHCKLEVPVEGKCPLVILQHGLTGHMEERHILGIKDALVNSGIAVLRTELYGHGQSDGEFEYHTMLKWLDEMLHIVRYARKLDFVSTLYLSGHSQGGLTALLAGGMAKDELDGLMLLAPAVIIRDGAREGGLFNTKYDPMAIEDTVTVMTMPNDPRYYNADYFRAARCLPVEDCVREFTKPVLIVHGDADELVPYHYATDLLAMYKQAELVTLPGDDHCFDHQLEMAEEACVAFMKKLNP